MADVPRVVILAGSNGAGKSTAARTILAEALGVMTFLNADVIATGLSGFDSASVAFEASRIMLERMNVLAAQRADFAFETTLSGRTYSPWLRGLRASGYHVSLFYIWLTDVELAVRRVAIRVSQGGHSIPEATIRQRYTRSIRNFHELYSPFVDEWMVYDNSGDNEYRLIAACRPGRSIAIPQPEMWAKFLRGG
jgi:predicted ABC-type ATPase